MIDPDMRNAVFLLYQGGMSQREISRRLHMGRNTVQRIIRQQGKVLRKERNDKILIDPKLLARLHKECNGWVQRMHEKLLEEEHLKVGYSTLTRIVRALDLASNRSGRCDQVADQPGKEMQHDTTNHRVKLGAKRAKVIASLLYLRFSKRRYLKFYFAFNRFAMKCFLHEALMFWKHAADWCIIDNTNLARLSGIGSRAVIVPEMAAFAERYGFQFLCHELGHANRKAGNERSFRTVETSFLPGREFQSLEDMNQQAFDWATQRMENRSQTKRRLIPAKVFEYERPYLKEVPPHLPAPYQVHERGTDQYGYVAFGANYYWVPGTGRDDVKVFQYADRIKIFRHSSCLVEYPLPPVGVRGERYSPAGEPKPRYASKKRRRDARQEDQHLRSLGKEVAAYLDFVRKARGIQRHRFTRQLFALSRKVPGSVFVKAIDRALRYRIVDLSIVERILWLCLREEDQPLPEADVDEDFQKRPAYQEGCLTDPPDLSIYDQRFQDKNEEDEDDDQPTAIPV